MSTSAGKAYHHGELRMALIAATLELLAEDGAEAVSLRGVARRAGVSAMAPYRHYSNKEALLAAVALQGFQGLHDALTAADGGAPPGQALVEQSVAYVGYARSNPAMFRLMFGSKRLEPHPDLHAAGEAAYGVLAARVAAETPVAALRQARALGCWAMVHGLAQLILDGRIGQKPPAQVSVVGDELIRQVAGAMLAGWHGSNQTAAASIR